MITVTQIVSLLTALGIGSILGIVVKSVLDRNAELRIKLKTINEEKYRTILIYMSIVINPTNKDHFILNDNVLYELKKDSDIMAYSLSKLNEYYYQSLLYASDDVMRTFKVFLTESNRDNYIATAQKNEKGSLE
ncbi:hypothetical protein [Mucilaginibacter sp. FT3.2]|uniref:hypothetical protein n=1 Tax=Mucilaginibacter sp. FT3.2 TaxID=2723090 RepID=UPI0016145B19|nr:hypothetical protein [Mucilaginibacter sp. FT3.2]MBB6233320.1 hypothetical protein [Mucilaginibacter sp. FT3.2]